MLNRFEPSVSVPEASAFYTVLNLQTNRRVLLMDVNLTSDHTDSQAVLDHGTEIQRLNDPQQLFPILIKNKVYTCP